MDERIQTEGESDEGDEFIASSRQVQGLYQFAKAIKRPLQGHKGLLIRAKCVAKPVESALDLLFPVSSSRSNPSLTWPLLPVETKARGGLQGRNSKAVLRLLLLPPLGDQLHNM